MIVDVNISLDACEKQLLDSFRHAFLPCEAPKTGRFPNQRGDPVETITSWHWVAKIVQEFWKVTHDDDWIANHQWNGRKVWDALIRLWGTETDTSYSCQSRLSKLLEENPQLREIFATADFESVEDLRFLPVPQDASDWKLVFGMKDQRETLGFGDDFYTTATYSLTARLTEGTSERSNPPQEDISVAGTNADGSFALQKGTIKGLPARLTEFEIWSLVRACSTLCRSTEWHMKQVREALHRTGFYSTHERYAGGFVSKKFAEKHGKMKYIWAFPEPVQFLEFIAWEELERQDPTLPYGKLLWRPEKAVIYQHHLCTEDEVFRFCIGANLYFPGYSEQNAIVFHSSPLKDSNLIDEMYLFWEKWNDCAITQNRQTGEWLLLQTVPGIQFRKLYDEIDQVAALRYFRRFVDDYRYGRIASLNDILGLKASRPQYEGLLEWIPFDEICILDPIPLGGSNGLVYRAEWYCPQKIHMSSSEVKPVALKTMRAGSDAYKDFLKELDATFTALQGMSVRCIEFYGITKTPSQGPAEVAASSMIQPGTLFLVFEWATKGSLTNYLGSSLGGEAKDWEIIFDMMEDLAAGLDELHKFRIVHRDIHRNNVLITTRPTPRDATTTFSTDLVVTDLGEGRAADSPQSVGRKYYGNVEYWAPEVKREHLYSFASDIYAAGFLFADMVQERWKAVLARTGVADKSVPACMLDLINLCTHVDPKKRPSADTLRSHIESLHSDLLVENEDGELDMVFDDMVQFSDQNVLQDQDDVVSHARLEVDEDGIPY